MKKTILSVSFLIVTFLTTLLSLFYLIGVKETWANTQEELTSSAHYLFDLRITREPFGAIIQDLAVSAYPFSTEPEPEVSAGVKDAVQIRLLDGSGSPILSINLPLLWTKFPDGDETVPLPKGMENPTNEQMLALLPKYDSLNFHIAIPFDSKADKLVVTNKDTVLAEENLGSFCVKDGKCQGKENYLSCPSDCVANAKDGFCNYYLGKTGTDPDCPSNLDWDSRQSRQVHQAKKTYTYAIIIGGIFLVLAITTSILLIIARRRKKLSEQKSPGEDMVGDGVNNQKGADTTAPRL